MITRSSDGQLVFLVNKLAKRKRNAKLGSRIAEVHNGSSLFIGDAGQGESNIRRWIIENDWLEAIIALPLNIFYNTGIAAYIWLLTNRKAEQRRGKVQLIDATSWFKPLRKNLGKKNCELSPEDIQRICDVFLSFQDTEQSKIFPNANFSYWKIKVERPLRLHSQFSRKALEGVRFASGDEEVRREVFATFGQVLYDDFYAIKPEMDKLLAGQNKEHGDEGDESENAGHKTALPEKSRKKLLDPDTWKKDSKLLEAARQLWQAMGDRLYEDHNEFRHIFDEKLKESDNKIVRH